MSTLSVPTVSRLLIGAIALIIMWPASMLAQFATGEVFVAVGNSQVKRFSPTGTLIATYNTGVTTNFTTGMAFDAAGNLYVTNFDQGSVSKIDQSGTATTFATGFSSFPESIVLDGAGDFYVGEVNGSSDVRRFSPAGSLLATYDVTVGPRGSDWIDMAADNCTIYYTSEGSTIHRFDVCNNTQLADFATVPSAPAYALRIRGNGEVLVAASSNIYRLSSAGVLLQTYPAPAGNSQIFALNLDPDGTSFWTADINSGNVYRIQISDGAILTSFNAAPNTSVAGLAIFKEPVAVCIPPSVTDQPDNLTRCAGESATFTVVAEGSGDLAYQWQKNTVDIPGANAASYTIPSVAASDAGSYRVVVTGGCDPTATSDAATLTVNGATPTLAVSASPSSLWPPNNKLENINITLTPSGTCAAYSIVLLSITNDETTGSSEYSDASFNTTPADVAFKLRAKRLGGGDGRVYTITYRMTYPIGGGLMGTTDASVTVTVPHDQGS